MSDPNVANRYRNRNRDNPQDGHSLGDVWQAIGKQTEDIATVRTSVAALDARVDNGISGIREQQAGISHQLNVMMQRVNEPPPKQDVKGWIALAVSIALVMGTIGWSNLRPVDTLSYRNSQSVDRVTSEFLEHRGYVTGLFEGVQRRVDRLEQDSDFYHRRAGGSVGAGSCHP